MNLQKELQEIQEKLQGSKVMNKKNTTKLNKVQQKLRKEQEKVQVSNLNWKKKAYNIIRPKIKNIIKHTVRKIIEITRKRKPLLNKAKTERKKIPEIL